jgi:hypothetical protein
LKSAENAASVIAGNLFKEPWYNAHEKHSINIQHFQEIIPYPRWHDSLLLCRSTWLDCSFLQQAGGNRSLIVATASPCLAIFQHCLIFFILSILITLSYKLPAVSYTDFLTGCKPNSPQPE